MDITAFGETKPLEQQMEHALRAYPAHMDEDIPERGSFDCIFPKP